MTEFTNVTPFFVRDFNAAVAAAEVAARQEAEVDQEIAMDHGQEVTRWDVGEMLLDSDTYGKITDPEIAAAYSVAYIGAWRF